jgi:hypothetical protein
MSRIKKNQKPIDNDAHFKYRCPNCDVDHWISFNQAKTKNYKIVCDCDTVIQPKRIKKIKIVYYDNLQKQTTKEIVSSNSSPVNIDSALLSKCVGVLVGYGFTGNEAESMVKQTHAMFPTDDCIVLIKKTLESIGVNANE